MEKIEILNRVGKLSPLTTREGKVSEVEIPVVSPEEWKRKRDHGIEVVATISEHIQCENVSQGRGTHSKKSLTPNGLCPVQRTSLAGDLNHVTGD